MSVGCASGAAGTAAVGAGGASVILAVSDTVSAVGTAISAVAEVSGSKLGERTWNESGARVDCAPGAERVSGVDEIWGRLEAATSPLGTCTLKIVEARALGRGSGVAGAATVAAESRAVGADVRANCGVNCDECRCGEREINDKPTILVSRSKYYL